MTSPEAFPVDSALPQLEIASDPGLMLELFRRHLRPLEQAYQIDGCHLSWIRYLRGTRCTLQYTLRLVESATGKERNQWVTGVIYANDRAEQLCANLRASDPEQEMPAAFTTFEPVSFIPDLKMLVQVFPYDRRLSALPLLMVGPLPDLESLCCTCFERSDWHSDRWNIEPVRYRAGARAVLRYQAKTRNSPPSQRRVYVKVYRDGEGARTYPILQALWKEPDARPENFTVGRPIGYLSNLQALFQAEAPGDKLGEILLQDRKASLAVRRVARTLAVFNQGEVATPRHHSREDEIAELTWVVKILRWARPDLNDKVKAIVGAVAASLEEVTPGPTHRDLMPDHVLLDGDRLALLDFDFLADADPVLDPASFLAHLFGMSLRSQLPKERMRTAGRAFTEEYFAHVPVAWRVRLPFHYAGAALKVAVGFFRRQAQRWPEKIDVLVDEARDSLAGRVW